MGYESTLLVCMTAPSSSRDEACRVFAQILATVKVGKGDETWNRFLDRSRSLQAGCPHGYYTYPQIGGRETPIVEDEHGNPLFPLDLEGAIDALGESEQPDPYAPFAREILRVFQAERAAGRWPGLVVLHYGD